MIENERINNPKIQCPRAQIHKLPHWNPDPPTDKEWKQHVVQTFADSNETGISLYIHLPYCESLCTYCGCNTRITVNHNVEHSYINCLLKEWDLYLDVFQQIPRLSEIHLGGGTPTFFSPKNLEFLLQKITNKGIVPTNHEFGFEEHPNNTTSTHLQTLYDQGFSRLSLGIQDFDPVVQKTINRIQSFKNVKEVTEKAREIGYTSINYDLIYGLPKQKMSSIRSTIEKVSQLMPDRIAFYSYAHVPWKKPGQRMFTELDLPEDEEKRAIYECGKEMLGSLGYFEIGMDHFALPSDDLYRSAKNGTMHRNFMGYTSNHTKLVVGLGASAIGDTWTAFAQNLKSIERYREVVESGELPIFRGHILNRDEMVLRKHILNLMCLLKTNWSDPKNQLSVLKEAHQNLEELINDGLVTVGENDIQVIEKGRPYVRNICMAIDPHMKKC